jgi:hypothetical protein
MSASMLSKLVRVIIWSSATIAIDIHLTVAHVMIYWIQRPIDRDLMVIGSQAIADGIR